MSQYQVYLNDEQKNYLLKYIRKRRYVSMMIMIISFVLILASFWLYNNDILLLNKFKGAVISFFLIFLMSFKVRNEVRLGNISWICLVVLFVVMNISLLGYETFSYDTNVFLDKTEFYISFIALTEIFITEFIRGFGKTFGHRCDIQCIQKDLYTLEYGDFGYREKDTKKHPYYICDNKGSIYICPRFLDYRNADTGSKFMYIKLKNGRNYAILDK